MIPTKPRRLKTMKLPKNLERLYKQAKCRDCTVVVTRMNFAKILGKFTKVKIQYETNSTPKTKSSPLGPRTKSNENGMSLRRAYSPHADKKLLGINKKNKSDNFSPRILKENNSVKKPAVKHKDNIKLKHYGIVFEKPTCISSEVKSNISLDSLLPNIDRTVLPTKDWCIDYFPKNGEPQDDKIYDRIAAELEDLMFNEKTKNNSENSDKNDEFPSILDILNDNTKVIEKPVDSNALPQTESSDVEAILLGKTKSAESIAMDVDHSDVGSLLTDNDQTTKQNTTEENSDVKLDTTVDDNPNSPSILNENSQSEVPVLSVAEKPLEPNPENQSTITQSSDVNDNTNTNNKNRLKSDISQVIFKKTTNGTSSKTVICPKNLKYTISIQGTSIELLGAPKVISSLEDLQILLQIVEESELTSLHVLH